MSDELEAGHSHRNVSSKSLAKGNTEVGAKPSGGFGTKPSEGEYTGVERSEEANVVKAGSVPNVSSGLETGKSAKKKAEWVRKQRLVSYSSQELQESDGAGSRKSSRKQTAVTKLGGVMIDSIF